MTRIAITTLVGGARLRSDSFGAVPPMRIEIPDLFDVLHCIDERGGVDCGWFFEPMPAHIVTRYDEVKAAFLDTEMFSPAATQEAMSFPLMGPTFLVMRPKPLRAPERGARPSANIARGRCGLPTDTEGPRGDRSILRAR